MDLLAHLKNPTATKPAPSATIDPVTTPPPAAAPTNFGETIVMDPPAAAPVAPPIPEVNKEESYIQSGKALAAMTDQIQTGFFTFLSNKKLNSKLTDAEKKVLIEGETGVKGADYQTVSEKFEKWMNKHEKLKSKIPFNPEERLQIEDAYTHYCRITGKAMPPELIIALNGISVISKRAIDVLSF